MKTFKQYIKEERNQYGLEITDKDGSKIYLPGDKIDYRIYCKPNIQIAYINKHENIVTLFDPKLIGGLELDLNDERTMNELKDECGMHLEIVDLIKKDLSKDTRDTFGDMLS